MSGIRKIQKLVLDSYGSKKLVVRKVTQLNCRKRMVSVNQIKSLNEMNRVWSIILKLPVKPVLFVDLRFLS